MQLLGKPEYAKFTHEEVVKRIMKTMKAEANPEVMPKYEGMLH